MGKAYTTLPPLTPCGVSGARHKALLKPYTLKPLRKAAVAQSALTSQGVNVMAKRLLRR